MKGKGPNRGPLLRVLDDKDPQTVDRNSIVRRYGRREFVFMEGQDPQRYSVVIDGRVKLVAASEDGKETILEFVEPGQVICPNATLMGGPYCCSAVTDSEHTDVLHLNAEVVDQALCEGAPVVGTMVRQMAARGSTMCKRVAEVTAGRVEQRLARILLRLSEGHVDIETNGSHWDRKIHLTRQDLAELCGTSPETVIRIMRKMEDKGFVALGRGQFEVLNRGALQDLLEGANT